MDINRKTILPVLGVLAFIGFRVYNRIPQWELLSEGNATVPNGQAWIQSLELYTDAQFRVTFNGEGEKMLVYIANDAQNQQIENGSLTNFDSLYVIAEGVVQRTDELTTSFTKGNYHMYFEPVSTERDAQISYKIEAKKN